MLLNPFKNAGVFIQIEYISYAGETVNHFNKRVAFLKKNNPVGLVDLLKCVYIEC